MSAFENRDYADGYRDGTRFAEVTITALRAENERLKVESIQMRAALGYGILAEDELHILPSNPFKCGTCDASKHLRAENETLRAALWDIHAVCNNGPFVRGRRIKAIARAALEENTNAE
jgi:hypothetical protein